MKLYSVLSWGSGCMAGGGIGLYEYMNRPLDP